MLFADAGLGTFGLNSIAVYDSKTTLTPSVNFYSFNLPLNSL